MPLPNSLRSDSAQPGNEPSCAPSPEAAKPAASPVTEPLFASSPAVPDYAKARPEAAPADAAPPEPAAPSEPVAPPVPAAPPEPNAEQNSVVQRLEALEQAVRGTQTQLQTVLDLLNAPKEPPAESRVDAPLADLAKAVEELGAKVDRNDRQLSQDLRENANFRIQVRQGMQHDIDELKAQQRGETLNPILREVAEAYCDYYVLLEESLSERGRRNLEALFDQLQEILNDNGAEIVMTEIGEERSLRTSKIVEKIPTGDERLHNHVALSRKPGAVRDRLVLRQELVDVYVYDPTLAAQEAEAAAASEEAAAETVVPEETAAPEPAAQAAEAEPAPEA